MPVDSDGSLAADPTNRKLWVAKYDPDGVELWASEGEIEGEAAMAISTDALGCGVFELE